MHFGPEDDAGLQPAGAQSQPDAYQLVSMWFDEWELILPADARQSFIDDLMQSVRAVTRGVSPAELSNAPKEPK